MTSRGRLTLATAALVSVPLALTGCADTGRTTDASGTVAGSATPPQGGATSASEEGATPASDASDTSEKGTTSAPKRKASCPEATASTASADPGATTGEQGGDANPKYAENHAFRQTLPLSGDALCTAAEETRRVKKALEGLAGTREATVAQVRTALTGLGYDASAVTASSFGTGLISYVVDLRPVCVEGSLGSTQVTAEAHGVYMEGTGCQEPAGGH
ncbi:hypothetical protein ACFVT5_38685 [Streptomyces sp. NPDC058001]|uniref:hypothetical protein n=1 Tax=Streptomyces sp. NPDC058001 TaxID=3346300 RepID=UPI0036F0CC82